jgi:hypothetical protein
MVEPYLEGERIIYLDFTSMWGVTVHDLKVFFQIYFLPLMLWFSSPFLMKDNLGFSSLHLVVVIWEA